MFINAEPHMLSEMDETKELKFTETFFKNIRILILCGGIYTGESGSCSGKRAFVRMKKTYATTILILYSLSMTSFCFDIYMKASASKNISRTVAFSSMLVASLYLTLIYFYRMPKELPDVEKAFDSYEKQYVLGKYSRWPRNVKIHTTVLLLSAFILYPIYLSSLGSYPGIMCDAFPMCNIHHSSLQNVVYVLNITTSIIMYSLWQGFFSICIFLSVFFYREFKSITDAFKKISSSTSGQIEKDLDSLAVHYECLVATLDVTNSCLQHYFFVSVFANLPINCFFLYSTLAQPYRLTELLMMCFGMFISMVIVGIRLILEAMVSTTAHGPFQYILKIRKDLLSDRGLHKISIFMSRLSGVTIGFNIYGLITINMPALLAIFGTLATYIIVVVQFRPADTSAQCDFLMKNISYCISP